MNHIKNIEKLEKEMIIFLSLSIIQPFSKKHILEHPIRIAEASKSLIGLNLDNPNKNIITFINKMKFKRPKKNKISANQYEFETVSIYQLKEAIIESDINKINKVLDSLLQLSDGKHILEYLVELSLGQSGNSLLIVWPIFKAMNFIGFRDKENIRCSINTACQALMYDKFEVFKNGSKLTLEKINLSLIQTSLQLHILGVLYEINNFNFIRKDLIQDSLNLFSNKFFDYNNSSNKELENIIINKNINILELIDQINLSRGILLSINALRSFIKYSNIRCDNAVARFLNLIIEDKL